MRMRDRQGFTLIEVVIVVAIIAVLASLGIAGITRHKDKTRVQTAARDMAQRIADARAIAEAAGSRIGSTTQLLTPPPCATPLNQVTVLIDPGANAYTVPIGITHNTTTDVMTLTCRTFLLSGDTLFSETRGLGTLATPTAGQVSFSFTSTGRIDRTVTLGNPVDWHFTISKTDSPTEKFSYRILPSGIICRSAFETAVRCNEDL